MNQKPLILAHRGALLNAPENTLKAFDCAFENGADGIECDVRITRDGEFVAFHDETTGRGASVNWKINRTKYAQLKNLEVFGREPIAHIDDIINLLAKHSGKLGFFEICFNDIPKAVELALKIVEAGISGKTFLLGFSNRADTLKKIKESVPKIKTSIMPILPINMIETARKAEADSICAGWVDRPLAKQAFMMTAKFCNFKRQSLEAEKSGIFITGGIANSFNEIKWFIDNAAYGIWTDDVKKTVEILNGKLR